MRLDRTVAEIAALLEGEVEGPSARRLRRLRALDRAGRDDLAPVLGRKHEPAGRASAAGCLLVGRRCRLRGGAERPLIRVDDADAALDVLTARLGPADPGPEPGVHPSAVVEDGVELGADVTVGPGVVLRRGARVGARTTLWAQVYVGVDARLGEDCELFPQVYVGARCRVGDRVRLHPQVCLGADGFGYRQDREGRHHKSPQVGAVVLGDDVELGAHVTIDRGRFEDTLVGHGCKLDDHVHVGHNSVFGAHCAVAGGTIFAGGVRLGDRVLVGGGCGVANNVRMGDGSAMAGMSLLLRDVEPGDYVMGVPAVAHMQWKRQVRTLGKLARARGGEGSSTRGA